MKLPAVAVVLTSLISTGCAGNALKRAAIDSGRSQAGVTLPELPDDCRREEPHAALTIGMEARVVAKAERRATNRANARVVRCAGFYDYTKAGLETP